MMMITIVSYICITVIAFLVFDVYNSIPNEHRSVPVWLPWLMLVPIAGMVIAWIMIPFKLPEALRQYAKALGSDHKSDFGFVWGITSIACSTASMIPFVVFVTGIPSIVFLILYIIQVKKDVQVLNSLNHQRSNSSGQSQPAH